MAATRKSNDGPQDFSFLQGSPNQQTDGINLNDFESLSDETTNPVPFPAENEEFSGTDSTEKFGNPAAADQFAKRLASQQQELPAETLQGSSDAKETSDEFSANAIAESAAETVDLTSPVNAAVREADSANDRSVSGTGKGETPVNPGIPVVPPARDGRHNAVIVGYAVAVTVILLFLLITGRVSLSSGHVLESLPDLRPLAPNEFRKIPDGTDLPKGHVLRLGETRRLGDVAVTPLRVTREPLTFTGFRSGQPEPSLTTEPVLRLWLRFENVAKDYGFPPFDAGLMSHRMPEHSTDPQTFANSFLMVSVGNDPGRRVLNFLQTLDNNFVLADQQSGQVVMPSESVDTFVASSEDLAGTEQSGNAECVWRIQFRKGVHQRSGNGITTLIDVRFSASDVQSAVQQTGA